MTALGRSTATILIRGDDLDPAALTLLLQVPPTSAARKGETGRSASNPTKTYEIGHWRLEAQPCEPGDLDTQISGLISRLPAKPSVWAELTRRYHVEMFCGIFMNEANELSELRPQTLRLLAERGLTLTLDLYGPALED
jgi:hypothetical protein